MKKTSLALLAGIGAIAGAGLTQSPAGQNTAPSSVEQQQQNVKERGTTGMPTQVASSSRSAQSLMPLPNVPFYQPSGVIWEGRMRSSHGCLRAKRRRRS